MKNIKLNNGLSIPLIGIGTNTFGKKNSQYMGEINNDTKELEMSFDLGYRLIDTAIAYRNEGVVGRALKKTSIPRSEFVITTKLPGTDLYRKPEDIRKALSHSLEQLNVSYIDILLIHHPWDNLEEILSVWKVLESYVNEGVIKTLGVSNFNEVQLSYLLKHATIKPALNQIESHPGFWQDDIVKFAQKNNVVIEAWGPLTKVSDEAKAVLTKIGSKYQKTWAQVALRYQIERQIIVIPKSHRFEGQKENMDIFDFKLTKNEILEIAKL